MKVQLKSAVTLSFISLICLIAALLFSAMNLTIAVFNLLPIPPLDGFHVLNDLILKGKLTMNPQFFQIAQVVLLVLVFSGALSGVLQAVTGAVEGGVLNLFLLIEGAA